jgi:aminoglycoside 3-N-acetyltransferase
MTVMECKGRIVEDLLALGVRRGGVLLVHSSFKSLGEVPGGIQTVIDGLKDALGPRGTLLLPGLSWVSVDYEHPIFDVRSTPSCVGAIPEYFRTLEGTARSIHPTHSVCGQGPLTGELFKDHILDRSPCGTHSPFSQLKYHGGQVLMLGCGLLRNTTIHAVEETAGAPYLFEVEPIEYTLTGYDGVPVKVLHKRHGTFPQHFDRVRPALIGNGLSEGNVLEAFCGLYDAKALWDCAFDMLQKDISCFIKD